jgi:hypothetical protein
MAQAKRSRGNTGDQGSASNEEARQLPAQEVGKRSPISKKGTSAGANQSGTSGRYQGSFGRTREDEDLESISSQADQSDKDLHILREEEISGSTESDIRSVNYSDTDEDENEGLGDGNLGRTVRGSLNE